MSRILSLRLIHAMHALTSYHLLTRYPLRRCGAIGSESAYFSEDCGFEPHAR